MLICTCIIIVITKNELAVRGAIEGIDLCLRAMIPSLFPLIFLVNILMSYSNQNSGKISKTICDIFSIPKNCEDLLMPILLGGYPVGVFAVKSAYDNERISKNCANRLLMYSNNPGPAFIFGVLGQQFENRQTMFLLWIVQIISCLTMAFLFFEPEIGTQQKIVKTSIGQIMQKSIHSISLICGWIVLFKVVISVFRFNDIFETNNVLNVATIGCIELSNGCMKLKMIHDVKSRFILCSIMLAFGGLCITMQSISAMDTLSKKNYVIGKCMNAFIAFLYSFIFAYLSPKVVLPFILILIILLQNRKIKSRFSLNIRV